MSRQGYLPQGAQRSGAGRKFLRRTSPNAISFFARRRGVSRTSVRLPVRFRCGGLTPRTGEGSWSGMPRPAKARCSRVRHPPSGARSRDFAPDIEFTARHARVGSGTATVRLGIRSVRNRKVSHRTQVRGSAMQGSARQMLTPVVHSVRRGVGGFRAGLKTLLSWSATVP